MSKVCGCGPEAQQRQLFQAEVSRRGATAGPPLTGESERCVDALAERPRQYIPVFNCLPFKDCSIRMVI